MRRILAGEPQPAGDGRGVAGGGACGGGPAQPHEQLGGDRDPLLVERMRRWLHVGVTVRGAVNQLDLGVHDIVDVEVILKPPCICFIEKD